jgi:hypothetical protein
MPAIDSETEARRGNLGTLDSDVDTVSLCPASRYDWPVAAKDGLLCSWGAAGRRMCLSKFTIL